MNRAFSTVLPVLLIGLAVAAPASDAGETPSPGPPWHATWQEAKAKALETGRPIFAYFTKKH